MRVLVTGGAGWTAEPLLGRLVTAGHRVTVLDPAEPGSAHADVNWVQGRVDDRALVDSAAEGTDCVIHMAVAVDRLAYEHPSGAFGTNVLGTYHVADAARTQGVARLVLMSSAPVHLLDRIRTISGDGPGTWVTGRHDAAGGAETVPPAPTPASAAWLSSAGSDHVYDLTKRLQEVIVRDFFETFGLSALILRAGHVVDGRTDTDRKGRALKDVDYCRGGWICRWDLATACHLAAESTDTGTCNVIGASPGRELFDVEQTERRLGFRIVTHFTDYT